MEVVDQKVFKDLTVCQEQSRGRYIQVSAHHVERHLLLYAGFQQHVGRN